MLYIRTLDNMESELLKACLNDDIELAITLIISGADVNERLTGHKIFSEGNTALTICCWKEHIDIIKTLLEIKNLDINASDIYGRTGLINAIYKKNNIILDMLLEKNADCNKQLDSKYIDKILIARGDTPLMIAIKQKNEYAINKLLSIDTLNKNICNYYNYTALTCAIIYKDFITAIKLIESGIDINISIKNSNDLIYIDGDSALTISAWNGYINIIEALVKRSDLKINQADCRGTTALMNAIHMGHTNIVKILIEHKADINNIDKQQQTILDYALKKNNCDIINVLLDQPSLIIYEKHVISMMTMCYTQDIKKKIINKYSFKEPFISTLFKIVINSSNIELFELLCNKYTLIMTDELLIQIYSNSDDKFTQIINKMGHILTVDKFKNLLQTKEINSETIMNMLNRCKYLMDQLTAIDIFPLIEKMIEKMRFDKYSCKICFDEQIETTFIQCGHTISCKKCADKLSSGKCPICNTPISKIQKIYF